MKQLFILSTKSSGSTALINFLTGFSGVNKVDFTRHQEHETLYWTKVASALDMEQIPMYRSIVPVSRERAVNDLNQFLTENLNSGPLQLLSKKDYFSAYHELVRVHGQCLVEKSPHHLAQRSNIDLIHEYVNAYPGTKSLIIGLVRDPVSVMYSAWQRWKYIPEEFEKEWLISMENMTYSKTLFGGSMIIIKYEDLAKHGALKDIFEFLGMADDRTNADYFKQSGAKKKINPDTFGYKPSGDVLSMSGSFGYSDERSISGLQHVKWKLKTGFFRWRYFLARRYRQYFKN